MSNRTIKQRQTNHTGFELQDWHREYLDYDCPAIDLDLVFIEYDTGEPVALVEYKHQNAKPQKSKHPSYQALIKLGTRAGVPVFAVRYGHRMDWFRVVALNELGTMYCPEPVTMSPDEYAAFMLDIRGRVKVPQLCSTCQGERRVQHPVHYLDLIDCPTCHGNGMISG